VAVGVPFERDHLSQALVDAGLKPRAGAVCIWLGAVPYLTRDAVEAAMRATAVAGRRRCRPRLRRTGRRLVTTGTCLATGPCRTPGAVGEHCVSGFARTTSTRSSPR